MGDRAPFVVGILAIVAVVATLVLRGDSAQQPAPSSAPAAPRGSAAIKAPQAPALPAGSATQRPELPSVAAPSADDVFLDEERDDVWAAKTEAEIAKRWNAIRGAKLASSECKRTQCRLVVTGAEPDVATAIADLEGPRGMHGFAENVLLTNPSKNADGTIALRIYVRFER